jgi:Flp pilus assembly protein CpaB
MRAGVLNRAAPESGTNGRAAAAPRSIERRRGLPAGRAVVGGLLVALAAIGIFAAYTGATDGPSASYAVVARDVGIGSVIRPEDVAVRAMDLPATVAGRAFRSAADLTGAIALAPLARGELVQRGEVSHDRTKGPAHQVSFALDRDRAVDGALQPGDRVDVLATYGSSDSAYTIVVVRGARVLQGSAADASGLGSSRSVVLTLAVTSADDVLAVAHAARAAQVTVVRTTMAGGDRGADEYRPPAPPTARGASAKATP